MYLACTAGLAGACVFDTSGLPASGEPEPGAPGPDAGLVLENPDAADPAALHASCRAILEAGDSTGTGVYTIAPAGGAAFDVFCDMDTNGGGWTLALKADGAQETFVYDSVHWTTASTFAPLQVDESLTEAKYDSFNRVPFQSLQLRAHTGVQVRTLIVGLTGPSLRGAFASQGSVTIDLGRSAWESLIPGARLDGECEREGVNVELDEHRLRLGIFAGGDDDCDADAAVGFGGAPCAGCGRESLDLPAVGADGGGPGQIAAFGMIFVR